MPKQTSNSTEPFSFRIPSEDREWLEITAKANGVEVAQIVRWAVIAIKQYVDAHDGHLHLPINIREMWSATKFPQALEQQQQSFHKAAEDPAHYVTRKRASGDK